MQRHVIHLDNGEVAEFTGELVAESHVETPRDPRTVAVTVLRVYRTDQGRYMLVMERSVRTLGKSFCLGFNSLADVADYVGRDATLSEAALDLDRAARDDLAGGHGPGR